MRMTIESLIKLGLKIEENVVALIETIVCTLNVLDLVNHIDYYRYHHYSLDPSAQLVYDDSGRTGSVEITTDTESNSAIDNIILDIVFFENEVISISILKRIHPDRADKIRIVGVDNKGDTNIILNTYLKLISEE